MLETDLSGPSAAGVPNGPNELIAMQLRSEQPEMSEQPWSAKVVQVFALMETLDLNAYEAQQIGVAIVRRLESFHDAVVAEMVQAEQVRANQVAAWAVDADRLMHSRILLENVALEGGGPC
jgi:hypothetical protein